MATCSSSDESNTAPKDFHLSSSIESGSQLSPNTQRCPLCCNFKNVFYCKDCVLNGDFCSSAYSQSYADIQLHYLQARAAKKVVEDASHHHMRQKQKVDELTSQIRQAKNSIEMLKFAIDDKMIKQRYNKTRLQEMQLKNEKLMRSLPKYEERVIKLESYVAGKREESEGKLKTLKENQESVQKLRKKRVSQLVRIIFPIKIVEPKVNMELSENEVVTALAEASHTTYVRDCWVFTDNSLIGLQHSIVYPTIPSSGNYNDYNVWVAQNKDAIPSFDSILDIDQNPAYSISAALTYTAQLINVIAYYLDIRLPHKMVYNDFGSSELREEQFTRRVARLNANILHLCFAQNVNVNELNPIQTMCNVLQLVNTENEDFGRMGPFEVNGPVAESLEEPLVKNLQPGEDSDSEEGDALPHEWEAVPHVQCPEATAGTFNLQSTITAQQASSVAGGLVTSAAATIASFWRGWTGKPF